MRRAVVKAEYLTSHGAPDWLAKVSSSLPAPMLETRFLGVDKFHHFRFWTRRQLAGLVRDTLSGPDRDDPYIWPYQLLIESYQRAQQVVKDHEVLDSQRK